MVVAYFVHCAQVINLDVFKEPTGVLWFDGSKHLERYVCLDAKAFEVADGSMQGSYVNLSMDHVEAKQGKCSEEGIWTGHLSPFKGECLKGDLNVEPSKEPTKVLWFDGAQDLEVRLPGRQGT